MTNKETFTKKSIKEIKEATENENNKLMVYIDNSMISKEFDVKMNISEDKQDLDINFPMILIEDDSYSYMWKEGNQINKTCQIFSILIVKNMKY